jgi:site-specific DNA recombinase
MTATAKPRQSRKPAARRGTKPPEGDVRVAVYTRISTDEEHQPYSLGAQDQRLRSYVDSQPGWALVRTFEDQKSGATLDRPGLQRALDEGRAGRFDLLLVYRVDRLARSVRGLAHVLEELDSAGVAFRSATEPFDTSTPAGRMMVQMLGVFAEFERETIIDRVIAGMERKAGRGEWVVGPRPFGYTLPPKGTPGPRHLVVDEDRAPLVAAMFDMYARQRIGAQGIANWLNESGHRTQRGKPWGHTAVLTVLRNRTYLGEVFFRGTWHPSPHPPLVDVDLFEKAQEVLAERGDGLAERASNSTEYLLSGLVVCHRCGKHYVGTAATGNAYRYRYYTCWSRNRYGTSTCDADRLPAEELDEAILGSLLATYKRRPLFAKAVKAAAKGATEQRQERESELAAVASEIAKCESSIERYFLAFENGTMPEARCAARVNALGDRAAQLRARHADLLEQLNGPQPEAPSEDVLAAIRQHVAHVMEHGPDSQRKAVMQALVGEVRVHSRDHIVPTFYVPEDSDPAKVLMPDGIVGVTGLEPVTSAV